MTPMEFFNIYLLLIFIFQFDNYLRQGQKLPSFLVLFKSVKSIGKLVIKKTTEVQEKKLSGSYSHLDKHSPN